MLIMKESIEKLNEIILTKKEIFRTAHRYAKKMEGDYKACFAYALKYTYACLKACKEKAALKGSLKQVAWATEIRDNISYRNIMLRIDRPSSDNEEYKDIVKKLEFIKILNSIENASVIICLAYQAIDSWYASIRRYKNKKNKVIEIGKKFNPNYFIIDEQGRFLQCEWGGTLYKKQYFNY